MGSRVDGIAEASALFDALPEAAQRELGVLLHEIIQDASSIQSERVPRLTGALAGQLSIQEQIDQLRARAGVFSSGRSKFFYARVIEGGRRAQTVIVHRRRAGAPKGRRKRVQDIAASYPLRVSPLEPRVFVHVEAQLDPDVDTRISDFWSRIMGQGSEG